MGRKIDIGGYLVARFGATFRRDNWRLNCPICGADRERFSVSTKKQVVHCWKCGYTNSVLGFVKDVESVDLRDAFRIISKYNTNYHTKYNLKSKSRSFRTSLRTSKQFTYELLHKRNVRSPVTSHLARKYLSSRGISLKEMEFWKLGISNEEDYLGYIISPFIRSGRLIYFVARRFTGGGPKYKNPILTEWGLGKSELLFNYEYASARENDTLIIVEGVYDVYATGTNAIALMGKVASSVQLSKIILANPPSIDIRLDADAKEEAFELASVLGELFPTTITIYKRGDPASNRITPNNKEEMQYSFQTLVRNKLESN